MEFFRVPNRSAGMIFRRYFYTNSHCRHLPSRIGNPRSYWSCILDQYLSYMTFTRNC